MSFTYWSMFFQSCTWSINLNQLSFNLAPKGCNRLKNKVWRSRWKNRKILRCESTMKCERINSDFCYSKSSTLLVFYIIVFIMWVICSQVHCRYAYKEIVTIWYFWGCETQNFIKECNWMDMIWIILAI